MKFFITMALATAALAAPYGVNLTNDDPTPKGCPAPMGDPPKDDPETCTPISYICNSDFTGWKVCTAEGFYVDGGSCPGGTVCQYINDIPYCIDDFMQEDGDQDMPEGDDQDMPEGDDQDKPEGDDQDKPEDNDQDKPEDSDENKPEDNDEDKPEDKDQDEQEGKSEAPSGGR
ncbi:hypothetical protein F5Y13DRAFT_203795 [Hypoxylon sp. FL1857]|nr:hypothetical protein F5Y13DRAFT_203795 [Hypoxylon sp. FL1857]